MGLAETLKERFLKIQVLYLMDIFNISPSIIIIYFIKILNILK